MVNALLKEASVLLLSICTDSYDLHEKVENRKGSEGSLRELRVL